MAMTVEQRKRYCEKAGVAYKAFWLRQSRYIQQVGDDGPEYVQAAPEAPVMVLLAHGKKIKRTKVVTKLGVSSEVEYEHDEHKADPLLVEVVDPAEPPAKPIPSHLPPRVGVPGTQKAHERHGKAPAPEKS